MWSCTPRRSRLNTVKPETSGPRARATPASDARAAKVERETGFGGDDLDACSHFPDRLAAGRERHEVAAVLDEQKHTERRPRQNAQILEADAANLQR